MSQDHPEDWAARAAIVAQKVTDAYGHRLVGLPGTWIGRVELPAGGPRAWLPWSEWHYWWQAHFIDCLVDAARREWHLAARAPSEPPPQLRLAQRVIRTIRLRNFGRFENMFFDDMAWLALAATRADRLSHEIRSEGLPPAAHAAGTLGRRLLAGDTLDLGGGMFWNTKRQYKNTAATGPAALFFARSDEPADRARAQALVDWLFENLLDTATGLFLDGIDLRRDHAGYTTTSVNRDIWTYNQGPALGALLELGDDGGGSNLARAEELVAAIAAGLTEGGGTGALRSDGDDGDHGLFRGILARYLALAAVEPRLPATARETAAALVLATAEDVWAAETRAPETQAPTQLSHRLQAWMVLEAAASVTPPTTPSTTPPITTPPGN